MKLEHLLCPTVGAQTHLCPPTFESGEARAPLPPFFYALDSNLKAYGKKHY